MKVPTENRATISLPEKAWKVASAVAAQDEVLSLRERPNISGAIAKIILDWQKMTGFNAENNGDDVALTA